MNGANTFMMISIAAYMVVVIMIGFIYARRNDHVGNFYLGGRTLGWQAARKTLNVERLTLEAG